MKYCCSARVILEGDDHRRFIAKQRCSYAVAKISDPEEAAPRFIAGLTVKPYVKYLGIQLGNITAVEAYAQPIAKMMAWARILASLPLRMQEKAYLFSSRVAPVVNLTHW
jgi:hypothetical protein